MSVHHLHTPTWQTQFHTNRFPPLAVEPRISHKYVQQARLPPAACPEAAWAAWAASSVSAPAQATSAPHAGCLVRSRVLKNRRGLFRVRHLQEADLQSVAQLQAACFHEALPLKPLDELAFTMFKAEVLSAVQKKTKVLADDGFTILVVESCSPVSSMWLGGGDGSSGGNREWDAAVWYGDQQAAAGRHVNWPGADSAAATAAAAAGTSPGHILGVIEVGVQDEHDVLQHLPRGTETYAYISSMAVAPHMRRCGIGAALLQAAEQQAALWQQNLVALHVYENNAPAIQLYQSHGLLSHASDPAWRKYIGGKVRQLMVKWL